MDRVLCFPQTPDDLPNNAVVWHRLSQNVHSEEKKHTNYFSNRNAQHFQYLIIKMYTTLCDTSSRDILQKSLQGKRKSSDFKYLYHFCPLT